MSEMTEMRSLRAKPTPRTARNVHGKPVGVRPTRNQMLDNGGTRLKPVVEPIASGPPDKLRGGRLKPICLAGVRIVFEVHEKYPLTAVRRHLRASADPVVCAMIPVGTDTRLPANGYFEKVSDGLILIRQIDLDSHHMTSPIRRHSRVLRRFHSGLGASSCLCSKAIKPGGVFHQNLATGRRIRNPRG
jgi:hypothetical protein